MSVSSEFRKTESEIRALQTKIHAKRAELHSPTRSSPRKSLRQPRFPGISAQHIATLEQLERSIAAKEAQKHDLDLTNAKLAAHLAEIEATVVSGETLIKRSDSAVNQISAEKNAVRATYDKTRRSLTTDRIAIQKLKRNVRTTDAKIGSILTDIEDDPQIQALRDQLTVSETRLRRLEAQNAATEEQIRLLETEFSVPPSLNSRDSEVLSVWDDPSAETHEVAALDLKREIKAKEQELREIESEIKRLHRESETKQSRFDVLWDVSCEDLTTTKSKSNLSVDQLIQSLALVNQTPKRTPPRIVARSEPRRGVRSQIIAQGAITPRKS
jgi:chromosome segregation ATPase